MPKCTTAIQSVTAAEVEPIETRWLLTDTIPHGELTIVGGAPGRGKTQLAVGYCAKASTGDLPGALRGQPADVAFVSCEDSISRTLIPRFLAAGGNPERIHFFETKTTGGPDGDPVLELPDDTPAIAEWLGRTKARILVLDPIIALIPTGLSGHKDQHVRRALAPLQRVLHELDVTGLALMHLSKDREADALNRLNGSVAFGAAARSVLLLAEDPDDPDGERGNKRILAHVKSNLGPRQPSLNYAVEPALIRDAHGAQISTSVLRERGASSYSANDLLDRSLGSGEATARDDARAFLRAELENGPQASNTLKTAAEKAGISWRTVERAKGALRARAIKGSGGEWTWVLPESGTPTGTYGGLGSLGGLPEIKVAKVAKAASANGRTTGGLQPLAAPAVDEDGDAELERITTKFGDLA